jgi:hypothetical protein
LPRYTRAGRVDITPTHIAIFGDTRVLEPLLGVTVAVQCATVPRFVRSYELFVDLPSRAPALQRNGTAVASAETSRAMPTGAGSVSAARSTEAPSAPRTEASPRARGQDGPTLEQGQTYVVVRGDTLSGIAARVGDRPGTIRATADAIFAANAEAFARGNPDLIQAGRSITIPVMVAASVPPPAIPAEPDVAEAAPAPVLAAPAPALTPPVEVELPSVPVSNVAEPIEPVSVAPSAQSSLAPVEETPAAEANDAPQSGGPSLWLTVVLALVGAIVLSVPLSFLWRPKREEEPRPEVAKPRAARRRPLVDPTAGIDVVEGELPHAVRSASASAALDFNTGALRPTDSVDLDVGTPTVVDERVDQRSDRTATLQQRTLEVAADNIDDEQHTLTIAEVDMLRADYEAEHTLTQEASKTLRDALADLKATEAAYAAGETATLEMPQSETSETQPTRRLRSAR